MATTTTKQQTQTPPPATSKGAVAVIAPPRLAPPDEAALAEYNINREGWRTLTESIFPAATTVTSVMMALDYCKRRKLDVFKHPVHIVPIWNSQADNGKGGKGATVETIWPGINELRTTAIRTGQYAGMDVPVFGPQIEQKFEGKIKKWQNGSASWETVTATVQFPEWCQITLYRTLGGNRVPFPGPRVYWLETYARLRNDCPVPNSMWEKRANGQIEKCAEAAALRRAFPEELGSDYSIDEIGAFTTHQPTDVTDEGAASTTPAEEPKRGDFIDKDKPADPKTQPDKEKPAGKRGAKAKAAKDTGKAAPDPKLDAEATRKEQLAAAGVTDVEDLSEKDDDTPITFQPYTRTGDFFAFADPWIADEKRTEAELVAFSAFYADYMNERLDPNFKSKAVHEAMLDTDRVLKECLKIAAGKGTPE